MNEEQNPPQAFPHYPGGIPIASSKDAGLLAKMVSRGLKAKGKGKGGKKGIATTQSIHITRRKQKFY